MNIVQASVFGRQIKKLHANQRKNLEQAVKEIIKDPAVGEMKKGDLSGVQVYKFKMVNQLTLLAYEFNEHAQEIILLFIGSHENFYRDLKK